MSKPSPSRPGLALPRACLVGLAGWATLGSGILNIYSVIGRGEPGRVRLLRELFPIDFIGLSRSITLLTGFFLVISSINVFKRKKRALRSVAGLAAASLVFHLTKGIDYEEALFPLILLSLLWSSRGAFTVKSREADLKGGVWRLGLAFSLVFAYGVAGFWLLERREFGVNFSIGPAIHETLLYLSLKGDPTYEPLTRYGRWFADSLYLATVTALIYSAFALFRPVVFRYATHAHEQRAAQQIVALHGRSPLDYFKTWPDKSYFLSGSKQTFLAYRVGANFVLVLGDPVGPDEEMEEVIAGFAGFCRDNDWGTGFYQVPPRLLPVYRKLGFKRLKIGDDAIVALAAFSLEGRSLKSVRTAVRKLERTGVHVESHQPPVPDAVMREIEDVSREWLKIPGRRERTFSLGQFDLQYIRSTPVMAAADARGRILAFANTVPSCQRGEASIDLMRRRIDAPNGIMDYLFVQLFLDSKAKGFERFNLGMAPMAGFQESEQSTPEERAVHACFQNLNFLFSYKGLRDYKAKFASIWEPRYVVYTNVVQLPRLALALRRVSELQE